MADVRLKPLGFNKISLSGSTVYSLGSGLTDDTIPAGADVAILTVETANVRMRPDSVSPAADTGVLLTAGATLYRFSGGLSAMRLIAATGSPVVNIGFYAIVG